MSRCSWSVILWLNISFSILVQISVFPSMFAPERASFDNKLIRNSNTHLRVHKYTQKHNLARKKIHYMSLHHISHFFSMETEWLKSSPFDNFNLIKSWCNSIKRWAGSHLNLNLWPEFPILWTIKTSFTLYVPVLSSIHLFKSKTSRI